MQTITTIGLDIAKSVFRAPRVGAFATAPSDGELATSVITRAYTEKAT